MKWLAASVSHETKNLLNSCGLHLQLLRLAFKHDSRAIASVDAMMGVLERGSDLVDLLREISAESAGETVGRANLNVAVQEAAQICRERMEQEAGVTIQTMLGEPPTIHSNVQELRVVVVALIAQAVEALPEGGGVNIVTGACDEGGWLRVAHTGDSKIASTSTGNIESVETLCSDGRTSRAGLQLAAAYLYAMRCGGRLLLDTTSRRATPVTLILPGAR